MTDFTDLEEHPEVAAALEAPEEARRRLEALLPSLKLDEDFRLLLLQRIEDERRYAEQFKPVEVTHCGSVAGSLLSTLRKLRFR